MFLILCTLVFLLPVLSGIGALTEKFSGNFFPGLPSKLLMGIGVVSVIWTLLAFFVPLNLYLEILTVAVGLAGFFGLKAYQEFTELFIIENLALGMAMFIVILAGSYFPFILDHFGYYVPTVNWLSQIGLVKGISNLDLLLGQMSVWHVFQAGFSNFSDPFLRMNVLVLVIYCLYIFSKRSWFHLLFLPVLLLFSQSPSPDLPVIVFSLIILTEILTGNRNTYFLFAFSALVFAMKPTMLWLPLLSFFYGVFIVKSNWRFLLAGTAVFCLFFLKNIYTFGFPVFPVQFVDLGVSWKPDENLLNGSARIAIEKTYDMQYTYNQIQNFSASDYIVNWFTLKGMKGKIHMFFIFTLISFFIYSLKRNNKLLWLIFVSVFVKSVLVLLFSAQYRFFIEVFFVVFFIIFADVFTRKASFALSSFFGVLVILFLSFPYNFRTFIPSFKLSEFMMGFRSSQFLKPSYFELKSFKQHQVGNLKFNVVQGYPFSFDTPLPAISPGFIEDDLDAGVFPQINGSELKDGFIMRKLNPEEKEKLKEIMDEVYLNLP